MSADRKLSASDVIVTFNDGEVKTYRITASPAISGYLAANASQTGILSLFNSERSWGIPLDRIRDWEIVAVQTEKDDDK